MLKMFQKIKLYAFALIGLAAISVSAGYLVGLHPAKAAAPSIVGTIGYPAGADNGTDIWEDTGPSTIYTANLIGATSGSPENVIAATTGKKVRILAATISFSGAAGTCQLQDEANTPNKLSGVYAAAQNGTVILPYNKGGWSDSASGAAIDVAVTGSSCVVGGNITYTLH